MSSGKPAVTPFGAWPSPIGTDLLVAGAVGLGEARADGEAVLWSELRPEEGGRVQIVRRGPDGPSEGLLPEGVSARTRVHEYGGGAWTAHEGTVVFSSWADQRLWRLAPGSDATAISVPVDRPGDLRYADHAVTPDGRWVLTVREDHRGEGEPVNELVAVAMDGTDERVLVSGPDFVSFPRISPDGDALAWTQWDHPRMPWDGTELWVAGLDGAELREPRLVAGGPDESLFQPEWSPAGVLHVVSDRTGWWNLYRCPGPGLPEAGAALDPVAPVEAEVATPQWVFAMSRYAFLPDGAIICGLTGDGVDRLGLIPQGRDRIETIDAPYTAVTSVRSAPGGAVFVGAAHDREAEVVRFGQDGSSTTPVSTARDLGLDPALLRPPEAIDFATSGGRTAHALFYPPAHPDHVGPADEAPPLLVLIHGGPTAAARSELQLGVRYWTSRGFAVVDVDYGGSVGYGRDYRKALDGEWGVVDVDDCVAAARHLADTGRVDPGRLAIRGGSAGGFTTLAALAFHDVFTAGASRYGVADLSALAADTHKFESRYLDGLVGPWPESEAVYRERSPIHHVDGFDAPLLVLQGLEDEIVPPDQSEMIVDALRVKGVPVAYLAFEGEQHGFRKAETVVAATEAELSFYAQVWHIDVADDLDPVAVENL